MIQDYKNNAVKEIEIDISEVRNKKMVSIVAPAYNEESIIEESLGVLYRYMRTMEDEYDWEIIVVNDGSKDRTGELADNFAEKHHQVIVIHHAVNQNLGMALKTGFQKTKGDYVIT